MHTQFLKENLKGRGKLVDKGTDERTALKWILMSWGIGV